MPHTQPHHVAARKHPEVESLGGRAIEVVSEAASVAQARGRKASDRVQEVVRDHPLASVSLMLGSGIILGAVAHRLLEHKPTFGEALAERVGVNRLRDRIRHWV